MLLEAFAILLIFITVFSSITLLVKIDTKKHVKKDKKQEDTD
jgi:hypothetical protein